MTDYSEKLEEQLIRNNMIAASPYAKAIDKHYSLS